MRQSLDRRFFADARRDDVVFLRLGNRIDHDEIAVIDRPADHAVTLHLEEVDLIGWNEAAVHGDEALAILGQQRWLTRVNLSVVGDGLRLAAAGKSEQPHAARAGRVALDVALPRK